MAIITIDGTGARASSLAEILDDIHERYRAALGEDLSLSPQTPQAQIAGITASIAAELVEAIVEDANASSIDRAGGSLLSELGSLLDIPRIEATRSRVTATLYGVAGTGVPAGSRARTANEDEFETLAPVVLSPDGVTVDLRAVESGPVLAAANSLTEIVTVIAGWERIDNAAAASPGVDAQSDDEYRRAYFARTARLAAGAGSAMESALSEAGATRYRVVENSTGSATTVQDWRIHGHSVLALVEGGSDGDIRRAVELRRGQGVGTMTAIRGGAPDEDELAGISAGPLIWDGATFSGLDLSTTSTPAERAAALTTLLATGSSTRPVTVAALDGRYTAIYAWQDGEQPVFADGMSGTVATFFGLDADAATASAGPFVRLRQRDLSLTVVVTRFAGFPADGLARIRAAVVAVADGYAVGEQAWLNDFLSAIESVPGTRASGLAVTHDGAAVSGVAVPLDAVWRLAADNIEITIS